MPAVAVERGTTKHERRVFGTVAALPEAVLERGLKSPTLIIVGNTVKLSPWWPWRDALGEPASPARSVDGVDGPAHAHLKGFQDGPAGEDTEAWFAKNARTVRRLRALSEAEAEEESPAPLADVSGKGEPVAS